MSETWLDAAKRLYPELDDEGCRGILWNTTCFPFGTPEQVVQQMTEQRERFGADIEALYQWVDDEMTRQMEECRTKYPEHFDEA